MPWSEKISMDVLYGRQTQLDTQVESTWTIRTTWTGIKLDKTVRSVKKEFLLHAEDILSKRSRQEVRFIREPAQRAVLPAFKAKFDFNKFANRLVFIWRTLNFRVWTSNSEYYLSRSLVVTLEPLSGTPLPIKLSALLIRRRPKDRPAKVIQSVIGRWWILPDSLRLAFVWQKRAC